MESAVSASPSIAPAAAPARFEKILDADGVHIITRDNATGLEWQATPFPESMTLDQAIAACAALTLGGHGDFRVPSIDELESIRDRRRFNPAIDTDAFPGCPSAWFWSDTPHAYDPSEFAWIVSFYDGSSYRDRRDDDYRVRAVRGASRQLSASLQAEG